MSGLTGADDSRRPQRLQACGAAGALCAWLATAKDPHGNVTQWSYDAAGNTLTETRPDNGSTSFSHNVMNPVLTSTDPAQHTTTFTHTAGNLTALTNANNQTCGFTYDSLGHKTSMIYPGGSRWTSASARRCRP